MPNLKKIENTDIVMQVILMLISYENF